ncbi:MAG: D-glycero-beta-D-manno-heptose-7-phosphate kinase [Candidatus Cloacimonetes bacterium]|nr:D-glycero-beta-D-manno-heptose-7-phosphate kinase [Candidatus Cloacimonadota bacterium]
MKSMEAVKIFSNFRNKRILIIGDVMLDHYLWGKVDRISPEAPVPVVQVTKEEYRLGGAANVANNISALGAIPLLCSVCGKDIFADKLYGLLKDKKISTDYLIADPDRPTIVKSRIISHQQQIVRVDYEIDSYIQKQIEDSFVEQITNLADTADAIIIEDYNKGLLSEEIIRKAIQLSQKNGIPITVDPKFKNFFAYEGCTVFKPNFIELQKNLGIVIEKEEDFITAGKNLRKRLSADFIIITRGEQGLTIFSENEEIVNLPTFAREVFDVSGAGDTVISVLTLSLIAGCEIVTAATLANHAAGVVCGKMGINTVTENEIIESIKFHK